MKILERGFMIFDRI